MNTHARHTFNRFEDTWTRAVKERCGTPLAWACCVGVLPSFITATPGAERVQPGTLNFLEIMTMWIDDYFKRDEKYLAIESSLLGIIFGLMICAALYWLDKIV